MKKIVSYPLETMPPVTDKQRARLKVLADRPDSETGLSDIQSWPLNGGKTPSEAASIAL